MQEDNLSSVWHVLWKQVTRYQPVRPPITHNTVAQQEAERLDDRLKQSQQLPFTVSVSGPPGVGKTTLTNRIASELRRRSHSVAILREEDELVDRTTRLVQSFSGINPQSFDLDRLLSNFQRLSSGQVVQVQKYDHTTGSHLGDSRQELPSSFILLDGSIWRYSALFSRIPIQHLILLMPKTLLLWKDAMIGRDRFEREYSPGHARANFCNYIHDLERVLSQIEVRYSSLYILMSIVRPEYGYWCFT